MVRRIGWRFGATVAATLLLVSGVIVATVRRTASPEASPLAALAPSPVSVTMTPLDTGGRAALGARIPVHIEATGRAIDSVTLWENSRRVADVPLATSSRSRSFASGDVTWLALHLGDRVLHASAHGEDGTGHSAPVRVVVAVNRAAPDRLVVGVPKGLSSAEFAARQGIDPQLIRVDTSESGRATVGASQQAFSLDVNGLRVAAQEAGDDSTAPEASTTPVPSSVQPSGGPAKPPVLIVARDGCTARITVTGTDDKLTVYHLGGASVGFTEIGAASADNPLSFGPIGPGSHVFTAGPSGEPTTTDPVALTFPSSCLAGLWQGNASLVDGILTIPAPDNGLLSMYVRTDELAAVRLPASAGQWFRSDKRHIDVTRLLPSLSGHDVHLEVWSYDAAGHTASMIASGDAHLPEGMTPADLIGEASGIELDIKPRHTQTVDSFIDAKWSATSTRVDRVVWQVTTQPVSASNSSLHPLGLIASGVAPVGEDDAGPGVSGTFRIPVAKLMTGRLVPVRAGPLTRASIERLSPRVQGPVPVDKLIVEKMQIDPQALGVADASQPGGSVEGAPAQPVLWSSTWFVRVVPMAGTAPLGEASGSIRFEGPERGERSQVLMRSTSVDFDAGRAANPDLTGCVRVSSDPWADLPPAAHALKLYPFPGLGTHCAGDASEWSSDSDDCGVFQIVCDVGAAVVGGVSALYDLATDAWDLLASAYNFVVDLVVEIVAKLNPVCIMASVAAYGAGEIGFGDGVTDAAQGAADLCNSMSEAASKAMVSAALASFGLPPELPSSAQLEAIAKGDLEELAVIYLESLGVPCDDLVLDPDDAGRAAAALEAAGGTAPDGVSDGVDVCRDLVSAAGDALGDQLKGMVQTQVASTSGLLLPTTPIPGYEFMFEPRGAFGAPEVSVSATTASPSSSSEDAFCRVTAWADTEVIGKPVWEPWTFAGSTFDITHVLLSGYHGSMSFGFNPPANVPDRNLESGTLVSATLKSECLDGGTAHKYFDRVDEPLGRWAPGQPD